MQSNLRQLIDQLKVIDSKQPLKEFSRDGDGNPTNYYTSTINFIDQWKEIKLDDIEYMKNKGDFSKEEIQSGIQQLAREIKMFQTVADSFLKVGLKGGFTELVKLETFYIEELGHHYTADDLDINGDYTRVMGKHLGNWGFGQ